MRAAGWLEIEGGKDGRSQTLALTPRGADLLRAARPAWERAQEEAEALLGADVTRAVLAAGDRLLAAGAAGAFGRVRQREASTVTPTEEMSA